MVADNNLNINMPITLRFTRADDLWLIYSDPKE